MRRRVAVLLAGLVIAGCKGKTTSSSGADASLEDAGAQLPPSSLDKVTAAETAGMIDHDTALLYELYVALAPDRLPAEYQGDDRDAESEVLVTSVMAQIP